MLASNEDRVTELEPMVVSDPAALGPYLQQWDQLAAAAGRPFCAPAWMLAWWTEGRSGDARLRVVLALDQAGRVHGVGPFFAQVGPMRLAEYRVLAAGFSHRVGPLATDGWEAAVASAIARGLATAHPPAASVVFEGIDAADPWPELIAAAWPSGKTIVRTDLLMDAPLIELGADYERWLAHRQRTFRKEAGRTARRLEEHGIQARMTVDHSAIQALVRLHGARWSERGGSHLTLDSGRVLAEAALRLNHDPQRLAVALLDGPEGPVAAELVVRAGRAMAFWAGGFDARWARHAPGVQAMLFALRSGADQGVELADLGGGAHAYKLRLSDVNAPLAWRTVFPLNVRYPAIRVRLAPKHLRVAARSLFRRLPAPVQKRLRRIL